MAYSLTYWRDHIQVNQAFVDRLNKILADQKIPLGSTLLLAARDFKHDAGQALKLPGYNLVLLAEQYDANGGQIGVTGQPGTDGAPGSVGAGGSNRADGGPGGNGEDGTAGADGMKVTLYCKKLLNAYILANGGAGGKGGRGGSGGAGGPGHLGGKNPSGGTGGGNGGVGGNGGRGGNAGQVNVIYTQVPIGSPLPHIDIFGGGGGSGGAGGKGGKGWIAITNGADGPQGNAGAKESDGQRTISQVDEQTFWDKLRAELGLVAAAWASYRLKVGKYFYQVSSSDSLRTALTEFQAVLGLDPANAQAQSYIDQIINNRNILGIARDKDIFPDFEQYQGFVNTYGALVTVLFGIATQDLSTSTTLANAADGVQYEIDHIKSLADILANELKAAQTAQTGAADDSKYADVQLADLQKRIQAKKQELDNAQISLGAIISVVGAVVGVIAAIPSAGASLLAVAPAVVTLVSDIKDTGVAGMLADLTGSPSDQKKLDEMNKSAGSIDALYNKTTALYKQLISFTTMISDLSSAHTDPQYVALLTQQTELIHTQLLAQLHKQQSDYEVQAVQGKIQQAQGDLAAAQDQLNKIQANTDVLDDAARTIISSVQGCVDIISKYAFFAARALEIYTLADMSGAIRYDYGYIHPDVEQDWVDKYSTRSDLIAAYQNSWNTFLGIATYSDQYLSYFDGNLVSDLHQLSFTDATVLTDFQQTASMLFIVDLKDLPANHFEAKVEVVYVSLIGAKAKTTAIPCIVEHKGKCALKKRDGTQMDMFLRPHSTIAESAGKPLVPADLAPPLTDPAVGPRTIAFWGRGIATTWQLSLQQDDTARYAIDLTGLTEIQVWIGYQCFLQTVAARRIKRRTGNTSDTRVRSGRRRPLAPRYRPTS